MADFPLPPVTAHSVTHGAASARAAHAHASGAADAASELTGGDDFAALLSQVAPDTVAGTKSVHIHGKGKHASSQESDIDPSDALDRPDEKSATAKIKGKPVTPASIANDRHEKLATDGTSVTEGENIAAGDPSQIVPQDATKTDDVQKPGRPEKNDHKSVHHKKDAAGAATALILPLIPVAAPVPVNLPAANLNVTLANAADTDAEQADEAVAPAINSPQAPSSNAPTLGRTGKAAKPDRTQASSQASSSDPQPVADAPDSEKDPATFLAQAVNRIVADAADNSAPGTKALSATGPVKTDVTHTVHNAANPTSPSNSANPATAIAVAAAAPVAQPAPPYTVQQPAVPQLAGVTMTSAPQATAVPQAATLSLHTAAPSTDQLPNLNNFVLDIAAKSHDGFKQFDIRMDPPELGRVDVRLSIDDSGKVQAHLTADQPQTLALLQKDAPALRVALRDAGLNMAQSGLNFSLKGQNPQQQNTNNGGSARGRSLSLRATAAIDAAQSVIPVFSSVGADTRLDIHV